MGYDCKYMDVNYITSSHNRYIYIYVYIYIMLYLSMLYNQDITSIFTHSCWRLDPTITTPRILGDVRWCAPTGVLAPRFFFKGILHGSVSKPCTPGEHQNSW